MLSRCKQPYQRRRRIFFVISIIIVTGIVLGIKGNFLPASASVSPPTIISYQGKLLVNGLAATTTLNAKLSLFTAATGGIPVYTASGTIGAPLAVAITPVSGVFTVNLGDSGTNSLDSTIFQSNQSIYLEVTIGSETLSPRKQIVSSPYAFNALYLNGVAASGNSTTTYIPLSDSGGNFQFNGITSTALVVNGASTLATTTISSSTITVLNATTANLTNLIINGSTFTNLLGAGLQNSAGALTLGTTYQDGSVYDSRFIRISGGSFTGATTIPSSTIGVLTVTSSVALPNNAISDAMLDDSITASNYLLLTGGVLSGGLTFATASGVTVTSTNLFVTGAATFTGASVTGLSVNQLSNTSSLAYLGNSQTFTNLNNFSATTTFVTTTIASATISNLNVASVNLPNSGVTAGSYGSATQVGAFTIGADGRITAAASAAIAINGNQITTGVVTTTQGGTAQDSSGWTGFVKVVGGAWSTSTVGLTADVAGALPLANGGTNANLTAVNGGIIYSGAASLAISASGLAGQILKSNGASAPTWISTSSLGLVSTDLSDTSNIARLDTSQIYSNLNTFTVSTTLATTSVNGDISINTNKNSINFTNAGGGVLAPMIRMTDGTSATRMVLADSNTSSSTGLQYDSFGKMFNFQTSAASPVTMATFDLVSGKVGIGTSTPSNYGYKLLVDAGGAGSSGIGIEGLVNATGAINGGAGLDVAESYPINTDCAAAGNCPESGDVVCLVDDKKATIEKCVGTNNKKSVGVVSTKPAFTLSGRDLNNKEPNTARLVALAGRVPVHISGMNGHIAVGDRLTTSDIPGVAVKATGNGPTIGIAAENYNSSGTSTIVTFVSISWQSETNSQPAPIDHGILTVANNSNGELIYNGGNLNLQGNILLNVASIMGIDSRWTIDSSGRLITRLATSQGDKEMFALESPAAEFIFSGSAALANGEAQIIFDPITQEIIDTVEPLKITITLTSGEAKGIYINNKSAVGFMVKELAGGTSNATFDWIAIAKRRVGISGSSIMEYIPPEFPQTPLPVDASSSQLTPVSVDLAINESAVSTSPTMEPTVTSSATSL